jgi:hypothetical protein
VRLIGLFLTGIDMAQGLYLLRSTQTQDDVGVRWNWTADLGVRAENVIVDLLYMLNLVLKYNEGKYET